MDGTEANERARADAGVLLPNTDPTIGELVLTTLYANATRPLPEILTALILQAPSEAVAREIASAVFELALAHKGGGLYWLETSAQAILLAARPLHARQAVAFGGAEWPVSALTLGPPKRVTIRVPDGVRSVWLASEALDGVVVRQSEAVALGNAMVEAFGGRIIEDRAGPRAMRDSFIEGNMTERAKMRAQATAEVERLTIEGRQTADLKPECAKVAAAEALPGSLSVGTKLHPEDRDGPLYEVQRRINDSWVLLVACEPGRDQVVEATAWVRKRGKGPFGADGPLHWAFTENASTIPQ